MGVHEAHCCILHGCKYNDDDCPVATRLSVQSYPCEDCSPESTLRVHDFKISTSNFVEMEERRRMHDIQREGAVPLRVGDIIIYGEYDFNSRTFSGRELRRQITAITAITQGGQEGLPDNICVMSLDS